MTAIRWTEQAVADLEAIRDYVARDSVRYATLLVEHLIASLDRVTLFPEIGRIVPEYQRPDLREPITGIIPGGLPSTAWPGGSPDSASRRPAVPG